MEVFLHVKNEKRGSLWLVTTARATILSHCTVIFIKANYRLCSSGCDLFTKDKCVLLNTSSVAAHTHTHTHSPSPSTTVLSTFYGFSLFGRRVCGRTVLSFSVGRLKAHRCCEPQGVPSSSRSSIDGRFSCFHILAIVNRECRCLVEILFSFPLATYPRMGC